MADVMGRTNYEIRVAKENVRENESTHTNATKNINGACSDNLLGYEMDTNSANTIRTVHQLDNDPEGNDLRTKASPRQARSPRCEAFVMTGEKMLNLNPKISPCYAKIKHDQLPPEVEVYNGDGGSNKRGPFDDFPSMRNKLPIKHRRFHDENVPSSQSEHFLASGSHEGDYEGIYPTDAENSARIRNADNPNSRNYSANTLPDNLVHTTADSNTGNIPTYAESRFSSSQSTPNSPAKRLLTDCKLSKLLECTTANKNDRRVLPNRMGSSGLVSARSAELSANPEAVARLAYHLYSLQAGFRLSDVAGFLAKTDDLSQKVSREFLELFNFSGKRLDAALRDYLDHLQLIGETSERARLLAYFSGRYQECNPALFNNADEIHALTCALILLNTDLHGANPGKKMTCREFVNNLLHTQYNYDRNMLKTLYSSIKEMPFKYHSEVRERKSNNGSLGVSVTSFSRNSMLINPNEQIDYKHGWVLKKSVYDSDGKRTPFGRRKWQMFYGTIRGMVLYLHKDEKGFARSQHEIFNNCVRLHHSFAEVPKDYTKKQHVFRLRTANFGEFLFQTSEPEEVTKWINSFNYVAAAFSTPVMPSPVSSSGTVAFRKPMLPTIPTTLSISEQLHTHQERLEEMSDRLAKLREDAPSMKAKGKPVYDYFYRERYLDKERERYHAYVQILSERLGISQADASSLASCSKKNSSVAIRYIQAESSNPCYHVNTQNNVNHEIEGCSDTFCLKPQQNTSEAQVEDQITSAIETVNPASISKQTFRG